MAILLISLIWEECHVWCSKKNQKNSQNILVDDLCKSGLIFIDLPIIIWIYQFTKPEAHWEHCQKTAISTKKLHKLKLLKIQRFYLIAWLSRNSSEFVTFTEEILNRKLYFLCSFLCSVDNWQGLKCASANRNSLNWFFLVIIALREKCTHSQFFWSVFSHIWTEYSIRIPMRENTDQKNSEYGRFSRSVAH